MSGIFGLIGLNDSDYAYVNTAGQALVFDAANRYIAKANEDMFTAISVFVEMITEDYKERYKLPGGGRLQKRGGQAQSGTVKASGGWDTAYPLEDFGAQVAATDVAMAYMTPQEFQRHVDTVIAQNANTVRHEILYALFNNVARTFVDEHWGSLTIQPLANADATVYPPVLGSETEATETHYLESGYAAASISDTNNPIVTLVDDLEEHFGDTTGGNNIVTFINQAQVAKIGDLTDFDEVPDRFIRVGDNTDVPESLPGVPGKIIGRANGSWIVQWRWIPANYLFSLHLDELAPLKMRVDPAATGLGRGLQLVARDETYPIESAHWRHRFGVGAGNRLNGVVMELGTGGTYTIPTAYQ
jgi:hypothetical protein